MQEFVRIVHGNAKIIQMATEVLCVSQWRVIAKLHSLYLSNRNQVSLGLAEIVQLQLSIVSVIHIEAVLCHLKGGGGGG